MPDKPDVATEGNSADISRGIIAFAAVGAVLFTSVLSFGDSESCSEAFGVTQFDGKSLTICNWVGWFEGLQFVTTLIVLLWSLRDIGRRRTLRRVPLYLALHLVSVGCYVVPSISFGFR